MKLNLLHQQIKENYEVTAAKTKLENEIELLKIEVSSKDAAITKLEESLKNKDEK